MAQLLKINSPATVRESESYLVRVTVTNRTFKAGQPWEATLTVIVSASVDTVDLVPYDTWTELFNANETRIFESALNIPSGVAGMTGGIVADVFDPAGNLLVSASESLVVERIAPPPAGLLYGIVTDAQTGAPLSMVLVSIAAPYEQSIFTDANGYYAFPNITLGNYTLYFNKDGYWVERIELALTVTPYQLNVKLTPVAVGVDHFVSCAVPSQVARGVVPAYPGVGSGTAEFWASQRVWLTAREGRLYNFELLVDKTGVTIYPAEYARPAYGISEDDVLWCWNLITYLPSPAQLKQVFPLATDGFYEGRGYALWGAGEIPVSLYWNCSTVSTVPWYVPPPRGVYKIISRCSIISCSLEQTAYGLTIRTWGQWVTLWTVDTGKTIEVI